MHISSLAPPFPILYLTYQCKFCTYLYFFLFYCCSSTVVSIFLPITLPSPTQPISHPQSYPPLALSMGTLYMFLEDLSPSFLCSLSSHILSHLIFSILACSKSDCYTDEKTETKRRKWCAYITVRTVLQPVLGWATVLSHLSPLLRLPPGSFRAPLPKSWSRRDHEVFQSV